MVANLSAAAAAPLGGTSYDRVHSAMVRDIISGTLAPGSRLKVEELSVRYQLSPMPIREALQRLQGEGLVILIPNRGARVRPLDRQFIADLYELRAALGAIIYRDMFASWTPEIAEHLSKIQRRYDVALAAGNGNRCRTENQNFHDFINSHTRNSEVVRVLATQNHLVAALRVAVGYSDARLEVQAREHWTIIESIARRDLAAASAAGQAHGRAGGDDIADRYAAKFAKAPE